VMKETITLGNSMPLDSFADDEIDLREYVKVIFRSWWMIAGLAILAALVAVVYSFLQPRAYEATAMIVVTKPQYQMNFDPKITTSAPQDVAPLSKALISLATGDEVVAGVLSSASGELPPSVKTADGLRGMLSAKATSDPSLVALKVRASNPQQAAAIANSWAQTLVTHAREVYGQSEGDVAYFEARLAEVSGTLTQAETALADFQARSDLDVLKTQLKVLQQNQQTYLAERENINRLVTSIDGFRTRLAMSPPSERVSVADGLTALLLEVRAIDTPTTPTASTTVGTTVLMTAASNPVQVQISGSEAVSDKTVGEMQALLESLASDLKARSAAIGTRLDEITPQILSLQGQVQRGQNELDRLTLARDVAKDTYSTVSLKTEEVRLASQGAKGQITMASQALPPDNPLSRGTVKNAGLAGALGLLVGIVGAFALEWWRKPAAEGQLTFNVERSPVEAVKG